ncbi:MAG: hypothetical protein U0Q21_09580 [Dermatophilaceae bacterium]
MSIFSATPVGTDADADALELALVPPPADDVEEDEESKPPPPQAASVRPPTVAMVSAVKRRWAISISGFPSGCNKV